MAKGRALGKGLGALIAPPPEAAAPIGSRTEITSLPIDRITPGNFQPRRDMEEEALESLAESIRIHGVVQPLIVRPAEQDTYQIVAGERRWRAARAAGLTEVPVRVMEGEEREFREIALVENIQREDLSSRNSLCHYRADPRTFPYPGSGGRANRLEPDRSNEQTQASPAAR